MLNKTSPRILVLTAATRLIPNDTIYSRRKYRRHSISAICHDLHSPVIIDESGIQRVIVQEKGQDAANRADIIHRGRSAEHVPCHREETTASGQFTRTCCVPVARNHLHSFPLAHTLTRQKPQGKSRKFLRAQSRFLPAFLRGGG